MTTTSLGRARSIPQAPARGPAEAADFGALYAQVQQFYAHQMQRFDAHEAERWAGTFTEDAVFDVPALPEPVRGRAGLAAYVRRAGAQQARTGERLRHWIGMLDVTPHPNGTLRTRAYALVYATPPGGGPRPHRVYVIEDVLVRARGKWRTRHRVVTRDDLT
ncbi:nuclear transport factor 2 family protein [Streptomyces sp. NPDC047821]|uniref:nuclear transport factor 2 family protein n=1 Tax=unclassified Streptomyces TaxID=2593676 RepID=UPI0036457B3D